MIDFRYHLVSLISVFMALAVGIVLGAGPLKEPIGSSLQSQVESLRIDRDNLRVDLDAANSDIGKLNDYVTASAPVLLDGTLDKTEIGVLRIEGTDGGMVDDVTAELELAGATVHEAGTLSAEAFLAADSEELLTTVRKVDDTLPEDPTEALQVSLARALAAQDGDADSEDGATDEPTADAGASPSATAGDTPTEAYSPEDAQKVLTAFSDAGRLTEGDPAVSDAYVVVAPNPGTTAEQIEANAGTMGATANATSAELTFIGELVDLVPTVLTGTTVSAESGLVSAARTSDVSVDTVDSLELSAGPVVTALTTAAAVEGQKTDDYGFGKGANDVMPEVGE